MVPSRCGSERPTTPIHEIFQKREKAVQHRNGADLLLLAQSIRANVAEGGVWNGNRVQEWVKTTLQKDLCLGRCYELLSAVGYSQQVPRPRHVEADQERQDDFKKNYDGKSGLKS